jgi:hypothetical protein
MTEIWTSIIMSRLGQDDVRCPEFVQAIMGVKYTIEFVYLYFQTLLFNILDMKPLVFHCIIRGVRTWS